jgi:hypothetical protein
MITRCVAVVLVTAGCAWGLAGCNKTPKADAAYKQNAQAIITALEKMKADVDNKSTPAVLAKDYADAQAARKTWDAALTPEQKEMDATNALNYALSRYGVVLQGGGAGARGSDPHMKAQDPASTAAAALDKAKQDLAALP